MFMVGGAWSNGYHLKKWTRRDKFKLWTNLRFIFELIPMETI